MARRHPIGAVRGEPRVASVERELARARQAAKLVNNEKVAAAHERKGGPAPKVLTHGSDARHTVRVTLARGRRA